jgi:hypothetical protein
MAPTSYHCSFHIIVWFVAEVVPPALEVNARHLESISALTLEDSFL